MGQRVPKKYLDFDGKPMIAWTIEAAIDSNIFSKVCQQTAKRLQKFLRALALKCSFKKKFF